jgi:hypothetical protein
MQRARLSRAASILDSEGYYQPNLEKIFASMERYVPKSDALFHKLTSGGLPQVSPPAGEAEQETTSHYNLWLSSF